MNRVAEPPRRDKRALIIHADGNPFNNPTLKCVIDMMLARGYEIDFRYPRSDAPMPVVAGFRPLASGPRMWRLKSILLNKIALYPLVFCWMLVENIFLYRRYDLIVAVDREGLIEAAALSALTNKPYILFSFEIMFASETSKRVKRIEKIASKNLALWVIQDEERAACLCEENALDPEKCMLVPLASRGLGAQASLRLRDELSIPQHKKVAILMGSLTSWAMAEEVILSALNWPDDWVLIIHERYGLTRQRLTKCMKKIEHVIGARFYISSASPIEVDDMSYVLAGVDVGLAFYKPVYGNPYLGKNLTYLGLASGKISTCLRYGVPIITNEIGLYAEKVRTHRLGDVVDTPAGIGAALSRFRVEEYTLNATTYFLRELDFNLYSEDLWEKMSQASRT
jgi:hypothetical protein